MLRAAACAPRRLQGPAKVPVGADAQIPSDIGTVILLRGYMGKFLFVE
jgi:hypothetical protein